MTTLVDRKDDEMLKAARNAIKGAAPYQIQSLILIALSSFRVPRYHRLNIMRKVVREYHLELNQK